MHGQLEEFNDVLARGLDKSLILYLQRRVSSPVASYVGAAIPIEFWWNIDVSMHMLKEGRYGR